MDTLLVLTRLSRAKREEYEPKIPELGDLLDQIRCMGRDRRIAIARTARLEREASERKHREEHPEEYMGWNEVMREHNARMAEKAMGKVGAA